MLKRHFMLWLSAASLTLLGIVSATAGCSTQAAYPSKAIDLVVAFAPGGGTDVIARVAAKYLSQELGVPVNVTNQAGGNQIPGVLAVLNAPPDGYTLLFGSQGTSSLHGIVKDLPYKLEERGFGPMMAVGFQGFFINGKSPWNSIKDVAETAKKDPGSFTWGRLGGTSFGDFNMYQFFDAIGVDVAKTKPVPFDGAGPLLTAVAGGHVMFGTVGAAAVLPLKASGDIKVVAVASDKRTSVLPDVPSTKEAGYPTLNLKANYMVDGPKALPKSTIDRLDRAAKKIVDDPGYAKDLQAIATDPAYMPPDQARDSMLKEVQFFKDMVAKFGAGK